VIARFAAVCAIFFWLCIAGCTLFVLSCFTTERVIGNSMWPSVANGERVLVASHLTWFTEIQRGDIVVIEWTRQNSETGKIALVKRIIGLPDEDIRLERGIVFVNGTPLAEPYAVRSLYHAPFSFHVPPDSYFVLGDNRDISGDSRFFGAIHRSLITGKIIAVGGRIVDDAILGNARK
jgi:signal peptidase I